MKKKYLTIYTVACLALLIAACGSKKSEDNDFDVEEIEEVEDPLDAEDTDDYEFSREESSSTDWDAVLDEYEKYVDSYIKLVNKVNKGDVSALSEYAEMLEKAESFADKLDNADDEMTAMQLARYEKITMKMSKVAIKSGSSTKSYEDLEDALDDIF